MSTGLKLGDVRVVFDTNIIISGLNFRGTERELLRLSQSNRFELHLSPHILAEVGGVLLRKFNWDEQMVRAAVLNLKESSKIVIPAREVSRIRGHEADNRVLSCAVEAEASFLVTGDRKHLLPLGEHDGIRIVSPADFHRSLSLDISE